MATHLCYRDGLNNLLLNSSVMCWSNSNNIYFLNFLQTMKMKLQNPWNVQSLYDLQYFNCPSPFCIYRNNKKQDFINHAYHFHPEADQYLRNINDGSTSDIVIPMDIKFDPSSYESDIKHESFEDTNIELNSEIVDQKSSFYNSYMTVEGSKKENNCEQCNIIFCNQNSLHEHKNYVHTLEIQGNYQLEGNKQKLRSKDYNCELCGKGFATKGNLKEHNHTVHEGNRDYKCNICGRNFAHPSGLKGHLKKCETFIKIACDECGKLVEVRLMDYHRIRVHIKPHKCEICGRKFGVASILKRHIKKHTEGGPKKVECKKCGKTFTTKYVLKIHIERRHAINVDEDGNTYLGKISKKVQCNFCNKWVIGLEAHKGRNHAEKVDIQCDYCGKPFDNRQKLKDHVNAYHNSKEMLKCHVCGNSYKVKRVLEVHIKSVHDKIKDHQCETCGTAFPVISSLNKHIRTVHLGERRYKCDLCGKTYKATAHLKTHKKTVHEGRREHVCNYCAKAFGEASDLKLHITVVHEGIKKWKCDQCPIKYGQSHQLKKHYLKTHGKIYHITKHSDI